MAKEWLEKEGHPEYRIRRIESLILATIPFTTPQTHLEKIIQDADLDNFGRDDCFAKMWLVEEELRTIAHLNTTTIYSLFWKLFHDIRFQSPTGIKERQLKKNQNVIRFEKIYNQFMRPQWKEDFPLRKS